MRRFATYLAHNWLTTLLGAVRLSACAISAWHNPATLMTREGLESLALGLVLLSARDPAAAGTLLARFTSPSVR